MYSGNPLRLLSYVFTVSYTYDFTEENTYSIRVSSVHWTGPSESQSCLGPVSEVKD